MNRRTFLQRTSQASMALSLPLGLTIPNPLADIPIGIIGLDTSHSIAFTKIFNTANEIDVTGFRVTHAYPRGSYEIESSYSRIPEYTEDIKQMGVKIVESIDELLEKVEMVLLETNDGRLHLEQAEKVFKAGKRVFIDKPIAASLDHVIKIFEMAKQFRVPMFSASSLRYAPSTQEVVHGSIGEVLGADTYSPAKLEATHPDLYWYGIHGVESLFTVMGTGCKKVRRIFREDTDVVIGEWKDGRIGTFRGLRKGKTNYGGVAFGTEGIAEIGKYEGYEPLVVEITNFFRTGDVPIAPEETIEIFAFMQAAEESKFRNGEPVEIAEILDLARGK